MQKLNLRFFASPCYAQNDGNGVIARFSQENRSNPENYDIISILKRLTPFAGLLRRCFATSRNDRNFTKRIKFWKTEI